MNAEQNTYPSIESAVDEQLRRQGRSIRNKAALGALMKIIPIGGEALHHALTAGDSAVAGSKMQLQLSLLCSLVEKIDAAISEMLDESKLRDAGFIEVGGRILVRGDYSENVTGLEISAGRSATINPGTVISVDVKNAKSMTGVKL